MPALKISPIAYRPSRLSTPCSPFSPRFPITLPLPQLRPPDSATKKWAPLTTAPPAYPLQWLWQCHVCKLKYPLGATRRCLEDSHYFCAGTSILRSRRGGKKVFKRHAACASEFDYQGWRTWGDWRRAEHEPQSALAESAEVVLGTIVEGKEIKDCWNCCDYPSECRWGRRIGFRSPIEIVRSPERSVGNTPTEVLPTTAEPATNFDDILQKMETDESPNDSRTPIPLQDDFWFGVLTSASKRRNQRSPLALDAIIGEQDERPTSPICGFIDSRAEHHVSPRAPSFQLPTTETDPLLDLDDLMNVDELDNVLAEMRGRR